MIGILRVSNLKIACVTAAKYDQDTINCTLHVAVGVTQTVAYIRLTSNTFSKLDPWTSFIHSLICMSKSSQWQLLSNWNKPVQTIH